MGTEKPLLRQINIVHISDLHFGDQHQFQAPISQMEDRPSDDGYPSLSTKLSEDLKSLNIDGPVLFCASGDFAETAEPEEFAAAEKFLSDMFTAEFDGYSLTPKNTFVVAGNHDVSYAKSDVGLRCQQWTEFYNRVFNTSFVREKPLEMCMAHDLVDEFGCVVVTLNSSIFVEKGTPDESRGRLGIEQLAQIERQLEKFDQERLSNCIKICMIHHHPVLIPQLAESGRGYDAVTEAGQLLQLLKRFNFHVVLHGHKHNPFTFTDDVEAATTSGDPHPIFFSCAGSIGSSELPGDGVSNCYNVVTIKFHPDGNQFRVRCETRMLTTHNEDGRKRLPPNWGWRSTKVYDSFFQKSAVANPDIVSVSSREFSTESDAEYEEQRRTTYERSRGYFPYARVRPSVMEGQAYEAVCEIVKHPSRSSPEQPPPTRVVWSAGKMFQIKEVHSEIDPKFRITFQYYGSMLVQARMFFEDGHEAVEHIYAPIPTPR